MAIFNNNIEYSFTNSSCVLGYVTIKGNRTQVLRLDLATGQEPKICWFQWEEKDNVGGFLFIDFETAKELEKLYRCYILQMQLSN